MKKGIERCIEALKNNEKIGIIADYDVDGSTSASILYKFLNKFTNNLICKIPKKRHSIFNKWIFINKS